MRSTTIFCVSAAIGSVAANLHAHHLGLHHKRQVTRTVWEEVVVTTTVTLLPGQHPPVDDHAFDAKKAPADAHNTQPTAKPRPAEADVHQEKHYQVPEQHPNPLPAVPIIHAVPVDHPAPPTAVNIEKAPQTSAPVAPIAQPKKVASTPGGGPSGGSCGSVGGKCSGDVTMYNDQGAGACGWKNDTNTDNFFALAIGMFGTYTNDAPAVNAVAEHRNAFCGRTANIMINGKPIQGTLTDACGGCVGQSIDLSLALWKQAYPGEAGTRYQDVEWYFTDVGEFHGPN